MKGRIETVLELVKGPDVLDLGCAGAAVGGPLQPSLHALIRQRYPSLWGLDSSAEAIGSLQERGWPNLHVGDVQDFDLGQKFDTVVAGELLEHVARPGDALKSARRHLKEGGSIIVSTPYTFGLHNWLYALVQFPKTCSNPEHVHWFCPTTLDELVRRQGLQVQQWSLTADYTGAPDRLMVKLFYFFMRTIGRLLPPRIRGTSMVFVITDSP